MILPSPFFAVIDFLIYSDSIILTNISDYLFYISSQCCSCVFCIHVASVFEETTTTIIYSDFIYGLLQFLQHFVFLGRVVWRQLTVFYSIFYLSSSILHRRYFFINVGLRFLKK